MPILKPVSVVFAALLAAAVCAQETVDRAKIYQWLDTNGYAYVATSRFIEYKVDWSKDAAPYTYYGFLTDSSADGFTAVDPFLSDTKYPRVEFGGKETATFQDGDFRLWASKQCRLYEQQPSGLSFTGFGALRATALARACAAHGLPSLENRFIELAKGVQDGILDRVLGHSGGLLGTLVAENRAWREQHINWDIADLDVPRAKTLEEVKRWLADYPDVRNAYMGDCQTVLAAMVKDESSRRSSTDRAAELIYELRDVKRYQYASPGGIFFAGDPFTFGEARDDAPGKLVKMGFAAVPELIEALRDRSFTRSEGSGMVPYAQIPRVQDAAYQILGVIAQKDFTYGEQNQYRSQISSFPDPDPSKVGMNRIRDEFAERTKRIEAWWKEAQKIGEPAILAKAVETGDPSFRRAPERLAQVDPDHAFKSISIGFQHEPQDSSTSDLVQALEELDWTTVADCAKQQMVRGKNRSTRVIAAELVAKHDPEAAEMAMATELKDYLRDSPATSPDMFGDQIDGVIRFLAQSRRPSVIPLLRQTAQKSEKLRYQVTFALRLDAPEGKPLESNTFDTLVEDFLSGELQMTDQEDDYSGRLCDVACDVMAANWPEKYKTSQRATPQQKDALRVAALNTWRSAHRLPAIYPVHISIIKPTSSEVIQPLIEAFCAAETDSEKKQAEAAIMTIGLPAFPAVYDGVNRDIALWNLSVKLSCIVREVKIKGTPPACGAQFINDLLKLKGTSLSADLFTGLINRDCQDWTANAPGLSVKGDRDAYGEGFVLEVSFPGIDRADGTGGWVHSTSSNSDTSSGVTKYFSYGTIYKAFERPPMQRTHFAVSLWHKS